MIASIISQIQHFYGSMSEVYGPDMNISFIDANISIYADHPRRIAFSADSQQYP
jgi:hypothetical protein